MIKFLCNKLGRDKGLAGFKAEGITPHYRHLKGQELCEALSSKLLEEAQEVQEAKNQQEIVTELADVLEVIDGLSKAYGISVKDILIAKEKKYRDRGGFEKGLFIETLEMDDDNPKVEYFRASPKKYSEI